MSYTIFMEVIILVGLMGAGKSSFYRERLPHYTLISKDLMKNSKYKEQRQKKMLIHALSNNQNVVIDNMNLTPDNRQAIISLAHAYKATVSVYYFPISLQESIERNAGPNRKEVPLVAIYTAFKKLVEPDWNEGFDKLYIIKKGPDVGAFSGYD